MPKAAPYLLAWSSVQQSYTLAESTHHKLLDIVPESRAWFAWLDTSSSFAFQGKAGSCTVRREVNRPGEGYWYAYAKTGGKLLKKYVGKTADLTLIRLEEVANALHAARATAMRMPTPSPLTKLEKALPLVSEDSSTMDTPLVIIQQMPTNQHDDLLATKLHLPRPRGQLVSRTHLVERLEQGIAGGLTLISAPAGFGKTTLVSQWVASIGRTSAWLSLDEADSDPTRFLTYLVAALQTIVPALGERVLSLLHSGQPPPLEAMLVALLNDLTTVPVQFVLVLDDYHVLAAKPIDLALTFLVEHLPPQMHLVIATREDPPLPLARLRARGRLTEVRSADLRFTASEAAAFLNQVMGLRLSAEDVAALERRTEGWIAGLHLAALSLQGQQDVATFIRSFTGSHRFVLDYLVEEVLGQQPESVQTFLLCTSVLDRMSGPLCDAVLLAPSGSGQATLEQLERANLFIVPLDNERRWYRYHHLFADLLRQRLQQSTASSTEDERDGVVEMHLRASQWYEDQGQEIEAFQHAVAAHDVERAERLIEGKGMPLQFRGETISVLNWLTSLPKMVLDARPSLWVTYASTLTMTGQPISHVEEKLQAAEAALQEAEPDDKTRDLIGHIAATRAMLAVPANQVETIVAQSRRALEYLHTGDLPVRATTAWTLGYAYQLQGDRAEASAAYTEAISLSRASGNIMVAIAATTCLGQVQEAENHLYLAAESYRSVLELAGDPPWPAACEAYLGLARVSYQWNDLATAEQQGRQSLHLAMQMVSVDTPAACHVLLARLKLVKGDVDGATALLAEAEQFVHQQHFAHWMPEIAAVRVQTLLRQGRLSAAAHLAQAHELPISQARVYLAQGDSSAALARLLPWRRHVEARGLRDEQLKVLVLQARALHVQGDKDQAVHLICEALSLAAPGGFIRLFADEGRPMAHLLSKAAALGMMPEYLRMVLSVCEAEEQQREGQSYTPAVQPLLEPLTPRELEVLHLMAQGLSNQEMSERLYLALDTVKGHNRKIFGKLQVERRTEAVARARELGLL